MATKFIRKVVHKSVFLFSVDAKLVEQASDIKVDSVFISSRDAETDKIRLIKQKFSDVSVYVEINIFAGADVLKKFPDAKPVEAVGKATAKDWYVGVCPTHEGVRTFALDKIRRVLQEGIDGGWLDLLRYPTKWEEPQPYLLDTCYCPRCMSLFEQYVGEKVAAGNLEELALLIDGSYYHEWLEFKTDQIASLVSEAKKLVTAAKSGVKLGAFVLPWEDKEYGAGIKRLVAQDFAKFAQFVDIFSPMLYHKMCGKDVSWVKQKVDYFWGVGTPFLPLIQTESRVSEISPEEFVLALEY